MAKVLDGNLLTYVGSGDPRRSIVLALVGGWLDAGETLHAPSLAPYEVASGLTQLIHAGLFPRHELPQAMARIATIPITWHPLQDIAGAVLVALRLGRRSAYDAAYISLAQQLGCELWTFDGPLARNAATVGFPVRLIGTG